MQRHKLQSSSRALYVQSHIAQFPMPRQAASKTPSSTKKEVPGKKLAGFIQRSPIPCFLLTPPVAHRLQPPDQGTVVLIIAVGRVQKTTVFF